ncbi:MAG: hypothetical protein OWV35_01585, partial [Firmicutes bacterium]|nr:hypothetical protein [Bacillota bacterium]
MSEPERPTVLVAVHPLTNALVADRLAAPCTILGQADSREALVEQARTLAPQAILVSPALPGAMAFGDCLATVRQQVPASRITLWLEAPTPEHRAVVARAA